MINARRQNHERWTIIIVALAAVLYVVYFSWFTIARHAKTNSTRFDLGNVEQAIWNTTHGRLLEVTDPYGVDQVSRLAFHGDLFLLVLVPFYAVIPATATLLILQTLALASGGLAVWLLAKRLLGSPGWALLLSLAYFANPALHWINVFDVHAVAFAVPLALWSVYLAVSGRPQWSFALAVLAALTKEEIGLTFIPLGMYLWAVKRQPRYGLAMILFGLLWPIVLMGFLLPQAAQSVSSQAEVYRTVFGSSAGDIVRGTLGHPGQFIRMLLATQNLQYYGQLLLTAGFFPLLSPWLLAAAPDTVINALSLKPAQHLIISHYPSGILPWLFISAIFGLRWLRPRWSTWLSPWRAKYVNRVAGLWLVGWVAYGVWSIGPLPGAAHDFSRVVRWRNVYAEPVADWARRIPTAARVSVTNNIGAHFARREYLYSFPLGLDRADYAVILEGHATPIVTTQAAVSAAAATVRSDQQWETLYHRGDLTVVRRRP